MIDQQKGIYTAPGVAGLYSLIAIRSSRRITQLRSQRPTSTWPVRLRANICSRRVQAGLDFISFQHYCKEERCINDTTVPSVIVRWVPGVLNSVVDLTLRSLTELRSVSPVFYGLSSVSLAPSLRPHVSTTYNYQNIWPWLVRTKSLKPTDPGSPQLGSATVLSGSPGSLEILSSSISLAPSHHTSCMKNIRWGGFADRRWKRKAIPQTPKYDGSLTRWRHAFAWVSGVLSIIKIDWL